MKKILALLLALMMAFSLVACGSSSDTSKDDGNKDADADTGDGKVYEIVALAKSIATDNWQMFGAGVQAAADELGADKVHVTFDGASAATEQEEQLNLVENYLASGCDALTVASDALGIIPILQNAQKNGTVCGIVDTPLSDYPDYDNLTCYDNKMAGEFAAQAMADALGDTSTGKIIIISPVPGVSTLEDRDAGFREKMAELKPDIEIVDALYCDGDNAKALANAQDAWQAYGEEIVGMYGLDEGVCDAISRCMDENSLQGKFQIVGIDATSLVMADVEKGNVAAVVGMSMYDMGYQVIMNLYNICAGNDAEKDCILDPVIITADNYMDDGVREVWDASILEG